ncbi:MAG: tail fiber protein [Ignavibacteria bacterium]|nr:tail fiber protein [Ignavibacteria bacterium]
MASTESYICSVDLWALNWAPRGFALCNGQSLPITQYAAVYSIIGVIYGGDGRTNFQLPDLQGRIPRCTGVYNNHNYQVGEKGGAPTLTLTMDNVNLPAHTHSATGSVKIKSFNGDGNSSDPTNFYPANSPAGSGFAGNPNATMPSGPVTVTISAASFASPMPFPIMPPYLVVNFIFTLTGYFPPRQ